MSFLSFPWLIALVTSSNATFNRNGKSRQLFLASDLKGKESFIIKNKISCWFFMDGLSQVKFLPTESIYHERMILLLYKHSCSGFPFLYLSIFPFLISFKSLVGHRTTAGKRKQWAAVHPLPEVPWAAPATPPSGLHSWPMMPVLSGTSCIPPLWSALLDHCFLALGPLDSCHSPSEFRSPFCLFPALAATGVWTAKGYFPDGKVSFSLVYQYDSTNILWKLSNALHCACLIQITLTIVSWFCS